MALRQRNAGDPVGSQRSKGHCQALPFPERAWRSDIARTGGDQTALPHLEFSPTE